jgi:hypothetical protein
VDTRAVEISDKSIKATTLDPLQTQNKSKSKSKSKRQASLDLAAVRLFCVASRVGAPPLAIGGANSIISCRESQQVGVRVTLKPKHRLETNKHRNLLESDRELMTAPHSICHPCPWRYWRCPELNHCSTIISALEQGSSVPSVAQPSPLDCTSTRRSQCPVGLYRLTLGTHTCTRTEKGTHICDDRCGATVDTGAVEISDESIKATTIDPLQTQSKNNSKSKAPVDPAALRLFRVASREWEFR